mmetsp:Transcript_13177/g.39230  ORF Transcript_13177/g.39230 Transcript_13177/m.39230 type:complete len:235 (-) Transcript_13177:192-896(-)
MWRLLRSMPRSSRTVAGGGGDGLARPMSSTAGVGGLGELCARGVRRMFRARSRRSVGGACAAPVPHGVPPLKLPTRSSSVVEARVEAAAAIPPPPPPPLGPSTDRRVPNIPPPLCFLPWRRLDMPGLSVSASSSSMDLFESEERSSNTASRCGGSVCAVCAESSVAMLARCMLSALALAACLLLLPEVEPLVESVSRTFWRRREAVETRWDAVETLLASDARGRSLLSLARDAR